MLFIIRLFSCLFFSFFYDEIRRKSLVPDFRFHSVWYRIDHSLDLIDLAISDLEQLRDMYCLRISEHIRRHGSIRKHVFPDSGIVVKKTKSQDQSPFHIDNWKTPVTDLCHKCKLPGFLLFLTAHGKNVRHVFG